MRTSTRARRAALMCLLAAGCRGDEAPPASARSVADGSAADGSAAERPTFAGGVRDEVSPFSAMKRDGERVLVKVDDEVWYELLAIDGVATGELVATARREFGPKAWKRMREDITMVLSRHGLPLRPAVDLTLRDPSGAEVRMPGIEMTKAKRERVRRGDESAAPEPAVERERVLAPEAWRADLAELRRLIDERHAYARLRGVSLDEAVGGATERLAEGPVTVNRLAAEVAAILGQLGDGHTRLAGSTEVMLPGWLPARIESVGDRWVALEPSGDALIDPEHPFLVKIDGVPIDRWEQAALRWGTLGSPSLRRISTRARLGFVQQLRADLDLDASASVRLGLADAAGDRREVERSMRDERPRGPRPALVEHRVLDGNVGYLRIAQMAGGREFLDALDAAMQSLRDTEALVIDVRDNGGGRRDALRHLFPYFVGDAPFVANVARPREGAATDLSDRYLYPADYEGWTEAQRAAVATFAAAFEPEWEPPEGDFGPWHYFVLDRGLNPGAFSYDRPLAVLLDEGCYSATDVFLGAFDHGTSAILVGRPSGGGSGRSREYSLPRSGLTVRLSSMASFQPDGKLYDGRGIGVDRRVEATVHDRLGKTDSVLDAAVARLRAAPPEGTGPAGP